MIDLFYKNRINRGQFLRDNSLGAADRPLGSLLSCPAYDKSPKVGITNYLQPVHRN